jgi:hypothetical protein
MLRLTEQLPVHKKRMLRLSRTHHLLLRPNRQSQAKRTPTRNNPKPTTPNEWSGIDRTTLMGEGDGWV